MLRGIFNPRSRRKLVLFLLSSVTALAWVLQTTAPWADGTVQLHLQLGNAKVYSDGTTPDSTAADAARAWNPAMARLQLEPVPDSTVPIGPRNGYNNVFFTRDIYGEAFDGGVLAVTITYSTGGRRVETDVFVNEAWAWDSYAGSAKRDPDLRRVLMHEFGHVLGLTHPDERGQSVSALMNSRESNLDSPVLDDFNGVVSLYGQGPGSPVQRTSIQSLNTNVAVNEGVNSTFAPNITGSAPRTHTWFYNGTVITGATNATYTLTPARLSDSGLYTLTATNPAGSASLSFRLTVKLVAPTIQYTSSSATINEDTSYTFAPTVTSSAPMTLQWLFNGRAIPGATTASYTVPAARLSDAGQYTLAATNSVGTSTASFHLIVEPVLIPWIFSTGLTSITPGEGEPFTLSFTAAGTPPYTYTWRRDGVILREERVVAFKVTYTTPTYSVSRFSMEDVGNYTLTVANAKGVVASQNIVVSMRPPALLAITHHPVATEVVPDVQHSVTLTAEVTGTGPYTFEWRKDGASVMARPNTSFKSDTTTTAVLKLDQVATSDLGSYTVLVSNPYGTVVSRPAVLSSRIFDDPLRIERQRLRHTFFGVFDFYQLEPQVRGGVTPYTYQWYKDGTLLPGQTGKSLSLHARNAADVGAYTVAITSPTTGERVVSEPEVTQRHPQGVFLPYATNLALAMQVGERLDVLYNQIGLNTGQWLKDGVALSTQDLNRLQSGFAQLSDSGLYSVVSTNDFGSVTRSIRFTVTADAPLFRRHFASQDVLYGHPLQLDAYLASGLWTAVQWEQDGIAISGATTSYYQSTPADAATAGTYRARVTTSTGATVYSEPIAVTVQPYRSPAAKSSLGKWKVPLDGEPVSFGVELNYAGTVTSYQWLKDGVPIPGAGNSAGYNIAKPKAEDAGTYTLVVTTDRETLRFEGSLSFISLPSYRISSPRSRTVASGQSVQLSASVTGAATVQYQWYKDGVAVPLANKTFLDVVATFSTVGRYYLVATSDRGTVTSGDAWIALAPGNGAPVFAYPPTPSSQTAVVGNSVTFSAAAVGVSEVTYQWRHNGVDIPGATSGVLGIPSVTASQAGTYTLVATNYIGSTVSESATLAVGPSGRLLNLSARALSRGGDNDVLIAGFVVKGASRKRVLIRGIGPALGQFGVAEALTDPGLSIYDSAGKLVFSNSDWANGVDHLGAVAERVGAFGLPSGSKDAALIVSLEPGNYTAHITHAALSSARVGLAELYDLDASTPRLINISTRARVQPGEGALISGFAVDQGAPKRLLIRATGPALSIFGVGDRLADPLLEIIRSGETKPLAANDNWSASDPDALEAAFKSVAAFDLPRGSADAALIVTLPPGTYTAKVTGADPTTSGNALIEVYELPAP